MTVAFITYNHDESNKCSTWWWWH